jgi:hypothetical protein
MEQDILQAIDDKKFEAQRHGETRQDYLQRLVRGIDKAGANAFEKLDNETKKWHSNAVRRMSTGQAVAEFPNIHVGNQENEDQPKAYDEATPFIPLDEDKENTTSEDGASSARRHGHR